MTIKPKPRARRKKPEPTLREVVDQLRAVPGSTGGDFADPVRELLNDRHGEFYAPVDGWKPDRLMMEECDFPTFEEAIAYSDAWFYWAVNRDEMI